MIKIAHEMLNCPSSLSRPMKVVVDMSSLDLALVAIMMCILRFFRYRYETETAESKRVEPQPVDSKSQSPPPIPPFQMYITPPSTPPKEHPHRELGEASSSETAVSHHAGMEKKESSSSPRSFPLSGQSSKKAEDALPPSPPPSVNSKKSIKSSASTKSDTTGKPIKRRSTQEDSAFNSFKRLCEAHGLLKRPSGLSEDDVVDGINDEATLLYVLSPTSNPPPKRLEVFCTNTVARRFFYAKQCDVSVAHRQFKEASLAREVNQLCSFYENIDVHAYEETRNLVSPPDHSNCTYTKNFTQYPHWIGRRDKKGQPICMFDFAKLDSKTMAAFKESSAKMEVKRSDLKMPGIVSTEMLRAFTIFDMLTRFVMPLCSAVPSRKYPDIAVTKMLCVVDISGMGLRQFWNMRGYMQDFAKLVGINYPEILDHVLVRLSYTIFRFQSFSAENISLNSAY